MEFDLRDWLLILGPVFVSGVLVHGYWRMRRGQGELKMSLDKSFLSESGEDAEVDDLSFLKAELPNGGARVTQKPISALDPGENAGELDLGNDVPVLLEPVNIVAADEGAGTEEDLIVESSSLVFEDPSDAISDEVSFSESLDVNEQLEENQFVEDQPEVRETQRQEEPIVAKAPPARKSAAIEKPEMFVVVNVLADEIFPGQALLESLTELDMTFGEMDIFHRLSENGEPEYSLVNAVEPGTFVPAEMDQMETPGVTLFMRAHEVGDPVKVFDQMIETAQKLALELGGELRDETKSVMTTQTIEHSRQSIQDFQYKHSA